jgi:hypothetical protein
MASAADQKLRRRPEGYEGTSGDWLSPRGMNSGSVPRSRTAYRPVRTPSSNIARIVVEVAHRPSESNSESRGSRPYPATSASCSTMISSSLSHGSAVSTCSSGLAAASGGCRGRSRCRRCSPPGWCVTGDLLIRAARTLQCGAADHGPGVADSCGAPPTHRRQRRCKRDTSSRQPASAGRSPPNRGPCSRSRKRFRLERRR